MICYDCGKFLKRGHGKNIYYYAGAWRYYCFFCLKVSDFHWKILRKKKEKYYRWLFFVSLLINALLWLISKYLIRSPLNSNSDNFLIYHLLFSIIPAIFFYILTGQLVIKPKLIEFKRAIWKPLQKEKERLIEMESYVNSLNSKKEKCHCEKCLLIEWKKKRD